MMLSASSFVPQYVDLDARSELVGRKALQRYEVGALKACFVKACPGFASLGEAPREGEVAIFFAFRRRRTVADVGAALHRCTVARRRSAF